MGPVRRKFMRRPLAAILAATALSTGFACPNPSRIETQQPRERVERIEWRADFGIDSAHTFIFDDCVPLDRLEDALAEYGQPYDLSARDVAESIAWGLFIHRYELPASEAPTLDSYLDEQIDRYGERFLAVTNILFERGPYDRTMKWRFYLALQPSLNSPNTELLRNRLELPLTLAGWLIDLNAEYDRMQTAWESRIARP